MKISKKLRKKISSAATDSFTEVVTELFGDEIKSNPETWDCDTKEKWDLLTELLHKIEEKIEEVIKND